MNLFRMVLACLSFITASQSIATAQSLGADVKIEQIGPISGTSVGNQPHR